MQKKKKKKGSVIKRALLFIGGVLLIVCIALNVTGIAGNKTSSPFDDSARKGFVTIGVGKGIMASCFLILRNMQYLSNAWKQKISVI